MVTKALQKRCKPALAQALKSMQGTDKTVEQRRITLQAASDLLSVHTKHNVPQGSGI